MLTIAGGILLAILVLVFLEPIIGFVVAALYFLFIGIAIVIGILIIVPIIGFISAIILALIDLGFSVQIANYHNLNEYYDFFVFGLTCSVFLTSIAIVLYFFQKHFELKQKLSQLKHKFSPYFFYLETLIVKKEEI